jgi:hypothetical protein
MTWGPLVRKTAHEIRLTTFFFKLFRVKNINELVVTAEKVTSNFAGLEPDVARGP